MSNAQQLVLRKDMATGLIKVGWAVDMPPGRFRHIDLIGESEYCAPLIDGNPLYSEYQQACQRARDANRNLIRLQNRELRSKGWTPVPFNLCGNDEDFREDSFGSYQSVAMCAIFHLTNNIPEVWAVIKNDIVIAVHARQAQKTLGELEYHVWKHHVLNSLAKLQGTVVKGNLVSKESGLWFSPQCD